MASLVETRNSGRESSIVCYGDSIVDVGSHRMCKALARYVEPCYRPEVSATSYGPRTCADFTSTSAWSTEEVWSNVRLNKRYCVQCYKIRMPSYWMPLRTWARAGLVLSNLTSPVALHWRQRTGENALVPVICARVDPSTILDTAT